MVFILVNYLHNKLANLNIINIDHTYSMIQNLMYYKCARSQLAKPVIHAVHKCCISVYNTIMSNA